MGGNVVDWKSLGARKPARADETPKNEIRKGVRGPADESQTSHTLSKTRVVTAGTQTERTSQLNLKLTREEKAAFEQFVVTLRTARGDSTTRGDAFALLLELVTYGDGALWQALMEEARAAEVGVPQIIDDAMVARAEAQSKRSKR